MSVSSQELRKSDRHQTFYAGYAYVLRETEWLRQDVKVYDQSDNGVRLRSMATLAGEKLYLQLDPSKPILALCKVRREHPIARNCWEFGVELSEILDMREVLTEDLITGFAAVDSLQQHGASIDVGSNARVGAPIAEQLDDLLNNQLGLAALRTPEPEPLPEPEPEPEQFAEPQCFEISDAEVQMLQEELEKMSMIAEPVAEELAVETTFDAEPLIEECAEAPEPVVTVEHSDEPTCPAEPSFQGFEELVSGRVKQAQEYRSQAFQPDSLLPEPAPEPKRQPQIQPAASFDLATPSLQESQASFVQTVLVGFAGFGSIAYRLANRVASPIRLMVGATVLPGSFFSSKTEEEHRIEWLQQCANSVGAVQSRSLQSSELND